MRETVQITGAALLGTVAAHGIYAGIGKIFAKGGGYIPAIAELGIGVLLALTTKRDFWRVVGGVMIAQGVLDALYAGQVIAVEL